MTLADRHRGSRGRGTTSHDPTSGAWRVRTKRAPSEERAKWASLGLGLRLGLIRVRVLELGLTLTPRLILI